LKKADDGANAATRGKRASETGDQAIQAADAALAGYDLDAIIEAYMNGRGARKQLKQVSEAVNKALESHGTVLARWQRSSGDFKSAHELNPRDAEAQFNAELVDKHIAELVDRLNALKLAMQCMGKCRTDLKQRMDQMKKLLPEEVRKQCENGDEDDEEEGTPKEPKEGMQEAKPKDGRERYMSPEEAARLLEAFKLDANRKLPMGTEQSGMPKNRQGREW
jgi:exonuclease VII small subunit